MGRELVILVAFSMLVGCIQPCLAASGAPGEDGQAPAPTHPPLRPLSEPAGTSANRGFAENRGQLGNGLVRYFVSGSVSAYSWRAP